MKRQLMALATAVLVQMTQAQTLLPVQPVLQNLVQLAASGSAEVPQDLLTLSLSTTREGADAAAVQAQLKTALDAALVEARKAAQPGQLELRTGAFSLSPRYTKEGKISTWQGTTELVLEGKDFAAISAMAGRIASLTVSGVAFGLSREQRRRVEAEVQAMAIERFKAKAADIARGFGFAGYTLREVSVQADEGGFAPRLRMAPMAAKADMAMAVPVEAGKATVSVTVSGSVQLK